MYGSVNGDTSVDLEYGRELPGKLWARTLLQFVLLVPSSKPPFQLNNEVLRYKKKLVISNGTSRGKNYCSNAITHLRWDIQELRPFSNTANVISIGLECMHKSRIGLGVVTSTSATRQKKLLFLVYYSPFRCPHVLGRMFSWILWNNYRNHGPRIPSWW